MLLVGFIGVTTAATDESLDIYSLSLEELKKIKIAGSAVRKLRFDLSPATANSLQLDGASTSGSIEILDSNTMEARGLKTVVETLENMTGVLSGESPSEPYSFSMRGFTRYSVNVLYDGISMGLSILNMRPQSTSMLDRVEIVKGPSVLAHGQGAAAGTVNLIGKQPSLSQQHHINEGLISYGTHDTYSVSAGFTGPISNLAAYRIDINQKASDGWVDDTDSKSTNAYVKLLWRLKPEVDLSFTLNYLDDNLPAYWGTPLIPAVDVNNRLGGVIKTDDNKTLESATRYNNYNVHDHVIASSSLWTRADLTWRLSDSVEVNGTLYHFKADRNWRNAESYIYDSGSGLIDRDRFLITHDRDIWGFRSGLLLQNQLLGLPNRFSVLLEHTDTDFDREVGFDLDTFFVDQVDFLNPLPGTFGNVDIRNESFDTQISALVFENRTDLTERLHLDLGARLERNAIDKKRYNFSGTLSARQSLEKVFHQQSYRLGMVYDFADQISGYVQFSAQHDPVEADLTFVYEASNFKPSDVTQSEIGIKATLDNERVELSLALFDIEKEALSQQNGQQIQKNIQKSTGSEFAIRASLTERIKIGGSIAHIDARYGYYFDAETGVLASNNTPVNVPETMANLWLSVDKIAGLSLEAGGGIHYVSSRYANLTNTATLQGYTLFNLFTAYTLENYRFALHARNLTDEIYAQWSDVNYSDQVLLGAPRTVEFSVQARF
ncbi:TonB-dependent siderophore receptor [Oceanicoccus sp. KOV_DT_Chl]|uniref:TonB-dependent receptor n=1 Tax=Oceanicoccus sp. KOV_DT_Chl TaxID=1904639 RepID=UPI001356887B|nr:TonB-dependent receptor [Oceanicoccus sp. KOV_DT_Chl]